MQPDVQMASKVVPASTLRFDNRSFAGNVIRLDRDMATLGRNHGNAYVVPDPGVSRVHAELRKVGSTVFVTDVGSSAGTQVNGQRIQGRTLLRHGDRVSFGQATATFEDPAAAAQIEDDTLVFALHEIQTGPHLSPRQQQVVELIAEGMTNGQIGDQLGITERTVKAYAQELFDKLGVRNRAGAVAAAWNCGLLGDTRGTIGPPPSGQNREPSAIRVVPWRVDGGSMR
jgi:pSer/pThr/pTyr-binding forkhead associated (FHA) protein